MSPWQNVKYHLPNLTPKDWFVEYPDTEQLEIKRRWAHIIELLLEYGADPKPFIHISAFEFDSRLRAELNTAIEKARRKWDGPEMPQTQDKGKPSRRRENLEMGKFNEENDTRCCLVQ